MRHQTRFMQALGIACLILILSLPPLVLGATSTWITIDDSVVGREFNQFNYLGTGWHHCTNCGAIYYNQTNSWTTTSGDSLTLTFTGTQLKFFGGLNDAGGQVTLSIDNGPITTVDFYSPKPSGNTLLWTSTVLSNGPHTFSLQVLGSHNSKSLGMGVVVDHVDILPTTAPASQVPQAVVPCGQLAPTYVPPISFLPGQEQVAYHVSGSAPAATSTPCPSSVPQSAAPLSPQAASSCIVTNTNDSGSGSLRQAILDTSCSVITFASPLPSPMITLTSGSLTISRNLTLTGPGATKLAVDGNRADRVFTITVGTVSISGLTIQNGLANYGGGIYISGSQSLTLDSSFLSKNTANFLGGGIYNAGTLTVSNSTFSGDAALQDDAGGIENAGMLTVSNSTFSGNSTIFDGGAINNDGGRLTVSNSTFSGNSARFSGGAIDNDAFTFNLGSTIVAGNTATISGPDLGGTITSLGHNLIGNNSGSSGLSNGVNGDQVGNGNPTINPLLNPLALNAPGTTQTMSLQSGSPALGKGNCDWTGNTVSPAPLPAPKDQRGVQRKSPCDVGAYEAGGFCSDPAHTVSLVALDPQVSVVQSMMVSDSTGLNILGEPGLNYINSQKQDHLVWGTSGLSVKQRLEFAHSATTSASEVWYFITDAQAIPQPGQPTSPAPRFKDGWIVAKTSVAPYVVSGDPCKGQSGLTPPPTLTFNYSRQGASFYAIAQAYANDTRTQANLTGTYGGKVSLPLNPGSKGLLSGVQIPYADFSYDAQQFANGASGSADFMSESIWMGGMPMSAGDPSNPLCHIPINQDPSTSGWQYCSNEPSNASIGWREHEGVISYYANNAVPGAAVNSIIQGTKGGLAAFVPVPHNFGPNWGYSPLNDKVFPKNLEDTMNDTPGIFEATPGDYVFINTGIVSRGAVSNHGLMMVGWGPEIACADALNFTFSTAASFSVPPPALPGDILPLFANRPDPASTPLPANWASHGITLFAKKSLYTVPYVVDFAGPSPALSRTQRPIPRPFYCTKWMDPGGSALVNGQLASGGFFWLGHSWWFVKIPEQVQISTNQIDAPPTF